MTESVAPSIICPTLIGRDIQRADLVQLLTRAHNERGQTLLIAGEAGIGKSRLVAELTQHATQQGIGVFSGRCFETDGAIPCALMADLVRAYLPTRPVVEMMQELGQAATEVAKLLPELQSLLSTTALLPVSTAEPDKRRLFETLFHTFVLSPRPSLIVVEDVHWSDNTSLDFLLFLARKIVAHPILLVITYRHNEVSAPLARLLAALDRERLAVEMVLARLTKAQTEAMLRAIFTLPRQVQEDFLDALYTLTEGNPFFIEEVLKSCVATGDIFQVGGQWGRKILSHLHIPRTVQVAVHQRVEQLTPTAQQLLKLAAVAGQRFNFSLLQEVSRQDDTTLITMLKELMAAQLVVEESADRFAFRHALTRQAVYFELLARERRTLHRAVAEVLEQQPTNNIHLPELAYHFYVAEEWRKTWAYARRAGEQAQRLYAPRIAVEHFTRALEAAHHLAEQDALHANEYDTAPLYGARGDSYETLGDFEAARADFERQLSLARNRGDSKTEWQSQLSLGFLWTSRDFGRAEEYYQQALAVARTHGEPAILAQSLNRVGNWYVNNEQPRLGQRFHDEALAIYQALNDQAGLAATLDLLAGATLLASDPRQSMVYYLQATALFRQLNEQRGLTSCLSWLAFRGPVAINLLAPAAPLSEGEMAAQDALHLAREIQWRAGEVFAMNALGLALGAQGAYGEALTHAENAVTLAQEIDHRWDTVGLIVLGTIYLDLGIATMAHKYFERARVISEEHRILFSLRISLSFLAATYLAQHQVTKAKAMLDNAVNEEPATFPQADDQMPTLAQRLFWFVRAQIALHENRAGEALTIAEQLIATTGANDTLLENSVPRLLTLRADALLALQRTGEAEQVLLYAQQAALLQGTRPLLWRIHQRLGQLYKERGDRNAAAAHFDSARSLITSLAASLPTQQLQGHFLQYALAKMPAQPTLTSLRARKQSVDGLTAREFEIALLVQQGKSDREIAETLSLSTRTVSTHIGNILAKLDFSSRTQIAAWAVTKGD